MQLTFESLAELQDFVQWVQAERSSGLTVEAAPKATLVVQDLVPVDGWTPEALTDTPTPGPNDQHDVPAPKQVIIRKRRTKAEMEAARAAAPDLEDEAPATPIESVAELTASPAVAVGDAPPVQTVAIDKGDSAEFIKSRLAERPEVSQVEHLNLARTFIGKHGMEKYNASFPLAGLTPNVMGYSPADCATHAAALDFLSLE